MGSLLMNIHPFLSMPSCARHYVAVVEINEYSYRNIEPYSGSYHPNHQLFLYSYLQSLRYLLYVPIIFFSSMLSTEWSVELQILVQSYWCRRSPFSSCVLIC